MMRRSASVQVEALVGKFKGVPGLGIRERCVRCSKLPITQKLCSFCPQTCEERE